MKTSTIRRRCDRRLVLDVVDGDRLILIRVLPLDDEQEEEDRTEEGESTVRSVIDTTIVCFSID